MGTPFSSLSLKTPWWIDLLIFILVIVSLVITLWTLFTQLTDRNSFKFVFQMISISVEIVWIIYMNKK